MLSPPSYQQNEPRRLLKSKQYRDIAIGGTFTLATCSLGGLYGWGRGYLGAESSSNVPVRIPMDKTIVKVSAGLSHAGAIDSDGLLYTWGSGGRWYLGGGQLGHGSKENIETPTLVKSLQEYGVKIKDISCAQAHTVILTEDGEVLTCGLNDYGRLGTRTLTDASIPETVATLAEEDIVQIATGHCHSMALTREGVVYTWGRGNLGQLGHSDSYMDIYSMEDIPRAIDQQLFDNEKILSITAGSGRSVAITESGSMYIWGNQVSHVPTLISPNSFNGHRVVKVACAGELNRYTVVVAVTEDGCLWTLGHANSGLLGVANASGLQADPLPVAVFNDDKLNVLEIFGGLSLHMAAIVEVIES